MRASRSWLALAGLMAAGAVLARWALPAGALDWQPGLWLEQPWRWWTAAFVHLSQAHFMANLLAVALVAAYGWMGEVPRRTTLAWLAAWPLGHVALLHVPELRHYGGLSGVLHAGVAAAAVHLAASGAGRQRWVGIVSLVLLALKLASETPWRAAVQSSPHWDIPIAQIAHLTGAVAGGLCSGMAERFRQRGAHA
ncbi:MAG: rhombosortase [Rhizobacter sp.]